MTLTFIIFIVTFVIATIPVNTVLKWMFSTQTNHAKSPNIIFFSNPPSLFVGTLIINFLIASQGLAVLQRLFYYDDDSLFLLGFILLLCGFFWSVFNTFKPNHFLFPFLCGLFFFFSPLCSLLFILTFLASSLLLNNSTLAYICSFLCCYLSPLLFETHPLFIFANTILTTLFFLRFNTQINAAFTNKKTSITHQINTRK